MNDQRAALAGRRFALLAAALIVLALLSIGTALLLGSVAIRPSQIVTSFWPPYDSVVHDIVWRLRAPRALAAFTCGGLLALAGALLQVLLRNPLADPYVLGVSSGASLGALAALAAGMSALIVDAAALVGALGAIALVFALSYRPGGWNMYRVLLTGVVLSAGLAALISLSLLLAPQGQVKGMLFWLMGDLSHADAPISAAVILCIVLAGAWAGGVQLDLLSLGETKAQSLGIRVPTVQLIVFFGAALATVAAVLLGGAVGFVGLMVPHAVRLLGAIRHRALLPLAVLLGGSFLTAADTAARAAWAPQQLPVGILTALLGVPAMLLLLGRVR
jgi:iron complex transport system permease protein